MAFMADGRIVEIGPPEAIFDTTQRGRGPVISSAKILSH